MGDLRVFELADTRDLAWREFGTSDGSPTIALHGSPGSHSNFAPVADVAAREGVRLIAVDRPGYVHSTFDPGRTYERSAADIGELADHLGLGEFAVLGWSSGGPNASSCARYLGIRVSVCAIVRALLHLMATCPPKEQGGRIALPSGSKCWPPG